MAPSCAVAVCTDRTKRHFFRFPKIPKIRKLWIEACHRKDKVNPDNALICSNHFLPDDFKRDMLNELLNLPLKIRLKDGVIPSQNLTLSQLAKTTREEDELDKNGRKHRARKRSSDDPTPTSPPKILRISEPTLASVPTPIALSSLPTFEPEDAVRMLLEKGVNTEDDYDTELVHEVMTLREQVAELSGIRVNQMIQIRDIKRITKTKNKEIVKLKETISNKTQVITELKERLENQARAIKMLRNALVTLRGKVKKDVSCP